MSSTENGWLVTSVLSGSSRSATYGAGRGPWSGGICDRRRARSDAVDQSPQDARSKFLAPVLAASASISPRRAKEWGAVLPAELRLPGVAVVKPRTWSGREG